MRLLLKIQLSGLLALLIVFFTFHAAATTYYVDINSPNPIPPYTNWSTASTDIQSAVNQTTNGDLVLVNPGVYQTGGQTVTGYNLTNRVVIDIPVTVQSVNGPGVTFIQGYQAPGTINSNSAVRCVYLNTNATLIGFTLTDGATLSSANNNDLYGGGAWCASTNAVLSNCVITANSAYYFGGGLYSGTAVNCLFTNNATGETGGGAFGSILDNCILAGNSATNFGGGAANGMLNNCFLENNWANQGGGAVASMLNNCTISNNMAIPDSPLGGTGGGVAMCNVQNSLIVSNLAQNSRFEGGEGGGSFMEPGIFSGVPDIYGGYLSNCILQGNSAGVGGGAALTTLVSGTVVMNQCTLTGNLASVGGGFYNASNPNYLPPILTNCTITGNGAGSGGGVYRAELLGCTLNGNWATNDGGGAYYFCTLANCILTGNSATNYGGGAYQGCALNNSLLSGNNALQGGGGVSGNFGNVAGCALNNCILQFNSSSTGGGANWGTLNNCLVISNSAESVGGGGEYVELVNCTVVGNSSSGIGGGDSGDEVYNSIIYNNTATEGGANTTNCYLSYCCTTSDSASAGPNNITNAPLFLNPVTGDFQLQSNSPCINSGNNGSAPGITDLAGNPRIVGGTVDIGTYEYQTPTSVISYAWLQQYGLPTDGSVDYADLDGTAFNIYQDWIAGLNPTNSASVLAMLTPAATVNTNGITVTWQSVSDISYFLQRSTNLPVFVTIQNGITGQTNTTSYTDTSATNNFPYLYRVGVTAP